jgi:hypothetical protein
MARSTFSPECSDADSAVEVDSITKVRGIS